MAGPIATLSIFFEPIDHFIIILLCLVSSEVNRVPAQLAGPMINSYMEVVIYYMHWSSIEQ